MIAIGFASQERKTVLGRFRLAEKHPALRIVVEAVFLLSDFLRFHAAFDVGRFIKVAKIVEQIEDGAMPIDNDDLSFDLFDEAAENG